MFKYSHGNVPVSVSQLFRTNNEYHNYNTSYCARIHAPVGTTEQVIELSATEGYTFGIAFLKKMTYIHHIPVLKKLAKIYNPK